MIFITQPSIFKWQTHFFIQFYQHFNFSCTHAPIVVTTTHPGCHHPPYLTGTPLHHLLALCHRHPTPSSPWATSKSIFVHTCMHTPDLGQQPPVPLILDPPWSFFNPSNHLPANFYYHFFSPIAQNPLNPLPFY